MEGTSGVVREKAAMFYNTYQPFDVILLRYHTPSLRLTIYDAFAVSMTDNFRNL